MPTDARYDILFEPVQIGPKTLRNRFYQVPHCTGFGVEKPWSQAAHRAVKAEGGWAAVCTEYCTGTVDADETPFISARMWDDHDLAHLALVPEAAHRHGSLAGIELSHSGAHGENCETRLPPPAPSQIASDFSNITPKRMERWDIDRIVSDWVTAAIRSRDAGLDIVYVYGGHAYLLGQMLSPFYNQRDDEYGGSLENRARMWIETLAAVRGAVGSDCAIACRVAISAVGGAGIDLAEGLEFVRLADHLVDLWDVHIGSIEEWSKDSGPSRFFAEGWQLEWTGKVREATAKPIVGVGRLTSPDRMAEIIESGVWDLIGAARPNIADPWIPRKIDEGRIGDIRECIGCNMCISKGDNRRHIGCTQNATAGEEHRRGWHPERFDRAANADSEVLVVGAGPAGMECAMVLGRRGMRRVRLVDAAAEVGGITRWVPELPGLSEWGRLREWRLGQLAQLPNVDIETGVRMDAAAVRAAGAGIVVIAAGAPWAADGLNGVTRGPIPGADASLAHVLTPEQVMLAGKRPPAGSRVVVSTARATSWARGWPSSWQARAMPSSSSRRARRSHPSATRRSRARSSAGTCTTSGSAIAPTAACRRSSRPACAARRRSATRSRSTATPSSSSRSACRTSGSSSSSVPRATRRSTGSATALPARSTPPTRPCRCLTCASARPPRSLPREPHGARPRIGAGPGGWQRLQLRKTLPRR